MKRFQQTAIAFAVAVIAPMAIAQSATTADTNISVTAEVEDMIQVFTNHTDLTLHSYEVEDWYAQSRLAVFRRGASEDYTMAYDLTVTGPAGSTANEGYKLSDGDNAVVVEVSYDAYKSADAGVEPEESGVLAHNLPAEGLPVSQSMYDKTTLHGQTNLHLTFKLPTSELEKAKVGTYTGDFTVMVAAK